MVRSAFRTLVQAYVATDGQQYITTDADYDALINEGLKIYAERTLCFFNDSVVLNLVNGTATYDLRDITTPVVTTYQVVWPVSVIINNAPLKNFYGRPGPITQKEFQGLTDGYSAAAGASPTRWTLEAPTTIRLYVKPNATTVSSGNNFVAGFTLPVDITAGAGSDSTEIPLPIEHERVAAAFVASLAIDPRASGSSLEKMQRLDGAAAAQMERFEQNAQILMGGMVRP